MNTPLLRIASAPGLGAVGVLLLLGPGSRQVLERALGAPIHGERVRHGQLRDACGLIEDVLCCWHPAANGSPGEEWAEVDTHGSLLALTRAAAALSAAGASTASDATDENIAACCLPEADAVQRAALAAIPRARTPRAVGVLIDQARGALSNEVRRLLSLATPDEAVEPLRALLARAAAGRACLCPPHVTLIGPANAGKSTLFNRLVGRDRALVHETPGTTRDRITEELALAGVPLLLSDTAGLRDTVTHPAERLGMSESLTAAQTADLVLLVVDPTDRGSWSAAREAMAGVRPTAPIRLIWSKSDRPEAALHAADCAKFAAGSDPIPCSAHTGDGLPAIEHAILAALGVTAEPWPPGTPVPFLPEHTSPLTEALRSAERGGSDYRRPLQALLEPPRRL